MNRGTADSLNSQQLKELSDELAALTKQQSDARLTEVFVRMTPQEVRAFNLRSERISKILRARCQPIKRGSCD
jgi:hypothetical protein